MGDVFKEQLVKKVPDGKTLFVKIGLVAVVILIFLVCVMIPALSGFAIPITLVAGLGAYYLIAMQNIEYEYIFTNGELDIDVIYNKSRRKRLFSGSLKEIELMAHVEDAAHTGDFSGAMEIKTYHSGVVKENTYAFLTTYKGKRTKFIIEPSEKMVRAFSTVLTPRVFFKR